MSKKIGAFNLIFGVHCNIYKIRSILVNLFPINFIFSTRLTLKHITWVLVNHKIYLINITLQRFKFL